MKSLLGLILSLCIALSTLAQMPVPKKPSIEEGLVLDYTNTLSASEKDQLNRKLIAYDDSSSNQVAIVIMHTTGDYPIEDVALQILRQWGVGGQEKKDNGIVILVAKDDRKVRIEVGYGLEGAIPDMTAASIIDHSILPAFKTGNYFQGLDAGTNAIIKAAAGEYKAPENYADRKKSKGRPSISTIIFILVILFILMRSGGRGGGGGGYVSRRGYRGGGLAPWIIGGMLGGGSSGSGWSGGGGGGWSGGGGGGFGGFGGGSGGGGGASGSW